MQIWSTFFEKKEICQETWISPNGRTRNQMDHILIKLKHAYFIKNIRSRRGADCDKEYFIVQVKCQQESPDARPPTGASNRKYNLKSD